MGQQSEEGSARILGGPCVNMVVLEVLLTQTACGLIIK